MPMLHDQRQSERHLERAHLALERSSRPRLFPPPPDAGAQRKRMLIALGVLLLALGAVIVRDWDFWFPSRGEAAEALVRSRSKSVMPETPSAPATAVTTPTNERKPAKPESPAPAEVPFAAAERAALPPLQVEVVAGNRRVSVPAKSNAIHLDVGSGAAASGTATPATNFGGAGATPSRSGAPDTLASAGDRVQLSPETARSVSLSVPPDYPLLARQMKVQGAVTLQALIARDGTIQELQVLSGPAILATAAREAVKQWRFKPYLQNGQPVETQARITVNFTISTN